MWLDFAAIQNEQRWTLGREAGIGGNCDIRQ